MWKVWDLVCRLSKLCLLITAMSIVWFLCFGFKLDLCDILYAFLFDVRNLNTWILDLLYGIWNVYY